MSKYVFRTNASPSRYELWKSNLTPFGFWGKVDGGEWVSITAAGIDLISTQNC
jgi:hypothetical protein